MNKHLKIILGLFLLYPILALAGSSEENRQELKYQAEFGAGNDYLAPSYGLSLARFLKSNDLIGFKVGWDQGTTHTNRNQFQFATQYKHFFGNSFYLAPELFYFNWFNPDSESERIVSIGAAVRLGNQWQWERFNLGVDWLTLGNSFIYFRKDNVDFNNFLSGFFLYVGWSWN